MPNGNGGMENVVLWGDVYGAPAAGPGGFLRTISGYWPLLLAIAIVWLIVAKK